MEQHEEVFFRTLRSALWGETLQIPEGYSNWGKVMKLAKAQAVTGLVGDVILRTPEIMASLSDKAAEYVQEIPMKNIVMHTVLNNTLILAVKTLRDHGIEPVLLKGQGLARYYPVSELRQCGDIDLYVGEENYEKAYEALKEVVTEIDEKESAMSYDKHFHAKIGAVQIEIHRFASILNCPKKNKRFQEYAMKGFTHDCVNVNIGATGLLLPNETFNVYYVFHHLLHHFLSSGVGVRHFCDLACLLHAKQELFDDHELKNILVGMKELRAWQIVGCILVENMGYPQSEFPFYNPGMMKYADRMTRIMMVEGNFGHETPFRKPAHYGYFRGKLYSFMFGTKRILRLSTIFPREMMSRFYYMIRNGLVRMFDELRKRSF